ncbi:MAG: DEAD/DEAH box helicase [Aestuariivirgaceae bacterium]|nr:DEAD/DEAH box helicase [Aestuariivirgaceae bacterium]
MTQTQIAAPLATALAAKGYETLTPVQQAMLPDGVAGRDLLVSAQTGSGKTVAFGIAIAPEILGGEERLHSADAPIALVIAPTRELAMQVARELEWLYGNAGARIATCVGGMDFRSEKRVLERGAHIVVGTPGRLRDHIERKGLDLSALRAVVLDEADEMLDLGFSEDLEFILSAAPEERRTLMFSATVSKEIAVLAKKFQRDAMRIQTQGEARQHVDIEYRVLTAAMRDRENAILNVLRFYEAPAAIVFCKTRANVSHLMARMGNRGLQVVALSGELSQKERTHALQSLRDGRAQVCIATDVAARGIDLPGLELVIHADLPQDSEILLHRSGRTGRAGKKGTSVLIVAPAESKKAQRLLQGAKIVAEWATVPTAEEVQARDDLRLLEHPALTGEIGDDEPMAATLLERFTPAQIATGFVRLWREGRSAPEVLSSSFNVAAPDPSGPSARSEFGASVWFELSIGRAGRAEPRWLLPKICEAAGITKTSIGAIRVQENRSFVQVEEKVAARFGAVKELQNGVTMQRMDGPPDLSQQERAPRAPYVRKPSRIVDEATPVAGGYDPLAEAPIAERKPHTKHADSERKPYVKRDEADRKPYVKREETDRKPYVKREEGDRKVYEPRPVAERKPDSKRADGPKPPWKPKPDGKRAAASPTGDKKPFRERSERPGRPSFNKGPAKGKHAGKPRTGSDAKDASKRFSPPRKPKP